MVEGHQGLDAVLQQLIAEVLVKFDTGFVDLARALGQDAGPADGKAVGFQAHLFHQGHILPPAVVKINGGIGVLAVGNAAGAVVDQSVPDGLALAVGIPAALDLGGCSGGAPQKVFREFGHINLFLELPSCMPRPVRCRAGHQIKEALAKRSTQVLCIPGGHPAEGRKCLTCVGKPSVPQPRPWPRPGCAYPRCRRGRWPCRRTRSAA